MKGTIFDGWGPWPRYMLVPVQNAAPGLVRVFDRWNGQDVFLGGVYTLDDGRRHKRELNAYQFVTIAKWRVAFDDLQRRRAS